MDHLLKYAELRHKEDEKQLAAASELLEYLYFMYVKPPFKLLRCSEEYKIAKDLLTLKKAVGTNRLDVDSLQTDFVRKLLTEFSITSSLTPEQVPIIRNNIIGPHSYYITAAYVADIVSRENLKELWRWVVTVLLTLLAAIASYGWLIKPTTCP